MWPDGSAGGGRLKAQQSLSERQRSARQRRLKRLMLSDAVRGNIDNVTKSTTSTTASTSITSATTTTTAVKSGNRADDESDYDKLLNEYDDEDDDGGGIDDDDDDAATANTAIDSSENSKDPTGRTMQSTTQSTSTLSAQQLHQFDGCYYYRPTGRQFPLCDFALRSIFDCLGVASVLKLHAALLSEAKVRFFF